MLRRLLTAAGVFTAVATLGASVALADVGPDPVVTTNGSAGYGAIDPAGFSSMQSVVTPTQYGTTIAGGIQGIQLCSGGDGFAAQAGLASTNTSPTYAVQVAAGTMQAVGCPQIGAVAGAQTIDPALSEVPFGHAVWLGITSGQRTREVKVLVCVKRPGAPAPEPTPSETPSEPAPSETPSGPAPSESPSATQLPVLPSATQLPAPPGDVSSPTPAPVTNPGPGYRCWQKSITLTRSQLLIAAQDLNADGTPNDAVGTFSKVIDIGPELFDHVSAGVNESQTSMVPCAATEMTAPAYTSQACQPVGTFNYTTVDGSYLLALNALEGISPDAGGALVAPNNSITDDSTGPAGTGPLASTAGSSFTLYTANAPVG